MSRDFLLEIGCEDIPGWMLPEAEASLRELLEKELGARGLLEKEPIQTYSTPRRLVACCARLAVVEPDRTSEVVGPPKSVAFSPDGKPTRAAESFAARQGVSVKALVTVETPKGEYIAAHSRQKGRPARDVLAEIIPGVVRGISFPRTMYWTSPEGLRFIRPIRWLLALFDGKVVRVKLGGLESGNTTRGHRLLSPAAVAVKSLEEYRRRLAKAFVVLDARERQRIIAREAERALKREGLRRRADIAQLEELANLTEHPAIVRGEFSTEFLSLPAEVLITVMRHHQKYIAVEDARGQLAPVFIAVLDLDGDASGEIRRGHETVLAARFRDAHFFWQADQKRSLAERVRLLDQVVFQAQLGSYAKKVNRVVTLTEWIARHLVWPQGRRADIEAAARAALLCKSDLTTEMVGEFPELQGIIGGLYARAQGEPEKVAQAIYEHYQPAAADASCPSTLEAAALALADKLDTIAACFGAGLAPTGSRDPFALRRAGTGVVRIVVEGGAALSLRAAVEQAVSGLVRGGLKVEDPVRLASEVLTFLEERARYVFRELRQHPFDEVNAVFAAGWDDLAEAAARLEAVRRLRPSKDFEPVAAAFKRIRNILEQAGNGQARAAGRANEELLEAGPERELFDRFVELRPRVAALRQAHKYEDALRLIASLRPQVDRFFDKVLVMAPDERVRENRLALLAQVLREFSTVADFSEIVVTPKG
ncbi:MAG TPA: glycine--tRNA ligase subunit beta [Candidatus Xenobia bacterium]|nr:glycine--tRNA ligase subunit beta [Candidatus Xenobia bacterium]